MKIIYNKNNKNLQKLVGFEPVYNGKRIDFMLVATLPTKLSILTSFFFKTTPAV